MGVILYKCVILRSPERTPVPHGPAQTSVRSYGRAGVNKLLIDWLATPDLDSLLQERVTLLLQARAADASAHRHSCTTRLLYAPQWSHQRLLRGEVNTSDLLDGTSQQR